MDLAVRRVDAAPDHEGVPGPGGVVGDLEHARDDGGAVRRRGLGDGRGEGAVDRLGVRRQVGARLAEVALEGLGEDDQVGVVGGQRGDRRPVVGGVEARAVLDEGHAQRAEGLGHVPNLRSLHGGGDFCD